MREYSAKEKKQLQSNPYTLKVTNKKLYFTIKFKEDFWIRYQAGNAPKRILKDLGYDVTIFRQKQIDSIVQNIKRQALSGEGFKEGDNHDNRIPMKKPAEGEDSPQTLEHMQHELLYLRQEVDFIKKIIKADNLKRKN